MPLRWHTVVSKTTRMLTITWHLITRFRSVISIGSIHVIIVIIIWQLLMYRLLFNLFNLTFSVFHTDNTQWTTSTLTKMKHVKHQYNYDNNLQNYWQSMQRMITMEIAFCKDISNSLNRFSLSLKWLASAEDLEFGRSLPFASTSTVDQGMVSDSCNRSHAYYTYY